MPKPPKEADVLPGRAKEKQQRNSAESSDDWSFVFGFDLEGLVFFAVLSVELVSLRCFLYLFVDFLKLFVVAKGSTWRWVPSFMKARPRRTTAYRMEEPEHLGKPYKKP